MTGDVALALSGSNLTGEHPFSCCLRLDGERHLARSPDGERGDLAVLVRDLLRAHGVEPSAIDELRVDVGPGSYTGLRVTLTFVRFLQHFGGRGRTLAADSLALLACGASLSPGKRVRPILDARRGRFHTATFVVESGLLRELSPPRAIPSDELLATIAPGDTLVIPPIFPAEHRAALERCEPDLVEVHGIGAAHLFDDTLPLRPRPPEKLEPRYLMASYAES